ncbi:MAG: hypothetical protein Q4C95_11820 [Planctomycetia bacterium]|nr:hypothetical protein [Planctomycetia bacterium]
MSYIDLINRFWRKAEFLGFSATEIAVYFYLLNAANVLGWNLSPKVSHRILQEKLCLSQTAIAKALDNLHSCNFIMIDKGAGRRKSSYSIVMDEVQQVKTDCNKEYI